MARFIRISSVDDATAVWVNRDHIVSVRPLRVDDPINGRTRLIVELKCTGMPLERIELKAGTTAETDEAWEALLRALEQADQ